MGEKGNITNDSAECFSQYCVQKGGKERRVTEEILDLKNSNLSLKGPQTILEFCLPEIIRTVKHSQSFTVSSSYLFKNHDWIIFSYEIENVSFLF